ncbi:MAG TPA: helix-turn-helix domain-containing protein [Candidatus Saccharimonadales bacterium]|nr:helix-turn-helix domain-containing protein [Candidatus Saccharimonadales bacterium]
MARIKDRQKAIELRSQGWTYGAIKKELGLSKSTLSGWLTKYPLNQEQLQLLQVNKSKSREAAIEKTSNIKRKKRELRLKAIYEAEKKEWIKLSRRELILSGLFLYWGEGGKAIWNSVTLNNTDPQLVKFTLIWLTEGFGIPKEKIKVYVHLYSDMNPKESIDFWSRELNLPLTQFMKPYIKTSRREDITHKGFGYGTCGLVVNNTRLKEKIMMGIKVIADHYSNKI